MTPANHHALQRTGLSLLLLFITGHVDPLWFAARSLGH
jgi:hypothetical protein